MNYKLVAYAVDFVSFLLQSLEEDAQKIKTIILFGSVARGEAGKQSDVDLFVETSEPAPEALEGMIEKIKEQFYGSSKVKLYWAPLGVHQEISCSVGSLEEWKKLEPSLIAQGIVLYGKYSKAEKNKPHYLFVLEQGKNRAQNLKLWRKLYGYSQKVGRKVYVLPGLVRGYGGEKIARGVFTIPAQHAQAVILFLAKNKMKHTLMPIWKP